MFLEPLDELSQIKRLLSNNKFIFLSALRKDNFFKEAANRQLSGLTNRNKNTVDRFLRDTVVVSVHTRNIGGQGLQ